MKEIPIALIPNETKDKTLTDVYHEQHQGFDILWYHWPQDGFFPVEDYEPVILIYDDKNEICCVCVRRGWDYKPAAIDELEYPIEIGFEGTFHHPYIRYKNDGNFEQRFSNYEQVELQPTDIEPSKIPQMARTGERHITLGRRAWIPVTDPSKKAKELQLEYCTE